MNNKKYNSPRKTVQTSMERTTIKNLIERYRIYYNIVRPEKVDYNKTLSALRFFGNSFRVEFAKYGSE
jgi:hypothetical protein